MERYSDELIQFIKEYSLNYYPQELSELVYKEFDLRISGDGLRRFMNRHNIDYKKKINWSKKKPKPIGNEVIVDGYIRIKVSNCVYKPKQRVLYEQHHKVKLKEDENVIFLDGDKNNFSIDNLMVIHNKEKHFMMGSKLFSKDPQVTELGHQVAKLSTKIKEMEKSEEK